MEKVIRDGKVAVLYSPGFGAGWFSWNSNHPEIVFHPKLIEMVEKKRQEEISNEWVLENLGIDIYIAGAYNLTIDWLPVGTAFTIDEYDGAESIRTSSDLILTA